MGDSQQQPYIHPTTIIGPKVETSPGVQIGAYCVIGAAHSSGSESSGSTRLGRNARIGDHCVIYEDVVIGKNTTVDPFCRVGPHATIGENAHLLYGARVHEEVKIGNSCVIAGNCPDRTQFGDEVMHLGRIAHSFHHPFADWDIPEEPAPVIVSYVAIGIQALIIGPVKIGDNTFIFPREVVRCDLPGNGIFKDGHWHDMPNWTKYLRILERIKCNNSHA